MSGSYRDQLSGDPEVPSLFDMPAPKLSPPSSRRGATDTSLAAQRRVTPGYNADCMIVLRSLVQFGAQTDFEVAERADRLQTSLGARRKALQRAGLVVPTSARRPSPSGSPCIVWAATAQGSALVASGAVTHDVGRR